MEHAHAPAAYLKRFVDATLQWHLIFASDRVRSQLDPTIPRDLEIFVGEARMVRWAMVATDEKVAEVWDLVMPGTVEQSEDDVTTAKKPNENILDYVMMGTTYIKTMVNCPSGHWNELMGELSMAITWPYRASMITDNIKDRAAEASFIKALFEGNPWTLFMYLLTIAPVPFDPDSSLPLDSNPTSSSGDEK